MNRMKTTPTRISAALNHIADRIDNSDNPSLSAVKRDINFVVAAMRDDQDDVHRIARDMVRLAMHRVAMSETDKKLQELLWGSPEGKDVDTSYNMAKRQVDDDKLVNALQKLKRDVDTFISDIQQSPAERKKLEEERKSEDEDVVTSAPPMK